MDNAECGNCRACIKVCPGLNQDRSINQEDTGGIDELTEGWGTVLEVWEGYATDSEIRHKGSSGGVSTALALYCTEKAGMTGVIHAGVGHTPISSKTQFSRTREDLLAATGSRYAPASPCEGLKRADDGQGQWVFIGKPCDTAGVRNSQKYSKESIKDIGIVISIFCAGTPSTQGTIDLLSSMNIPMDKVRALRYRGDGWPGKFCVTMNGDAEIKELTYHEAWGFVQKYRPYRCYLCPDGTGEFADIACGDPWYREIKEREEGYSLILVRTERGRKILQNAITAGYITAEKAAPEILEKSQTNLYGKRAAVWGRLLAFKLLGIPAPSYGGFPLSRNWMTLPVSDKARSTFGTLRRIIQRGYYRPLL
jgi:coenzyme F420 hydrogenase subunit beta